MEKKDAWISLKEEKPKNNTEIIFYCGDVLVGNWYDIYDYVSSLGPLLVDDIPKKSITHWMPYPKPPISQP